MLISYRYSITDFLWRFTSDYWFLSLIYDIFIAPLWHCTIRLPSAYHSNEAPNWFHCWLILHSSVSFHAPRWLIMRLTPDTLPVIICVRYWRRCATVTRMISYTAMWGRPVPSWPLSITRHQSNWAALAQLFNCRPEGTPSRPTVNY